MRAKRTIRDRGLPYEVPEGAELSTRLPAVLAVIYLVHDVGERRYYSAAGARRKTNRVNRSGMSSSQASSFR